MSEPEFLTPPQLPPKARVTKAGSVVPVVPRDDGKQNVPFNPQPGQIKEPLRLVYKYTGTCPRCANRVETIEIPVDKSKTKIIVVAWCPVCKTQSHTQTVQRLSTD